MPTINPGGNNILSKCCPCLPNYMVSQTGLITTTASVEVLVAGLSLMPSAGIYLVHFTGCVKNSNLGGMKLGELSIFSAGIKDLSSILNFDNMTLIPFDCIGIVTVNGLQLIEARWRLTNALPPPSVLTIDGTRTLRAIRIA